MAMLGITATMSPKGVKALISEEGEVLESYQDSAGVWTVGVGHTGSKYAQPGVKITKAKSRELLKLDLKRAEEAVSKYVKVDLTEDQANAVISFVYNVGVGAFSRSTLLKKLNNGDYFGAADEFLKWDKATVDGKKVTLRGLSARRARERAMFLSGTEIQTTDDLYESNIEADEVVKPSVSSSKPIQALGATGVAGVLSEASSFAQPLAEYDVYFRILWIVLTLVTLFFILKERKDD